MPLHFLHKRAFFKAFYYFFFGIFISVFLQTKQPTTAFIFLAQLQRPAQINSQLDHVLPGDRMSAGVPVQRRQELHPDQDVPANVIRVLDDLMILVADHVAVAFQAAHQGKLLYQLLHKTAKISPHTGIIHAVRLHLQQL